MVFFEFVCLQSGVQGLRACVGVSMEMDRLVKVTDRMRIYCRSSSTHAGDDINLSILNNGGRAENTQDSEDELRAVWTQSLKDIQRGKLGISGH